jgi:hypothetical protein
MKQNILTHLRTVSTLDSMETMNLSKMTLMLTSTRIPTGATTRTESFSSIAYLSVQSIEELTRHDIRKAIIEDLQRSTTKLSDGHRQDVIRIDN